MTYVYSCADWFEQKRQKPIYPLTDEQEQELIDFDDNYASQYDSLIKWEHEVALFGDATFPRPIIEPLIYPDELQHWIDLCWQYNIDLAEWEAGGTEDEDECLYDAIPF